MKVLNKILLFERNTFFRNSLRKILQDRFPDVAIKEVSLFEECVSEMRDFKPDILFIGSDEQSSKGLKRLHQIRNSFPAANIIFFTEYDIDEYRKGAVMAGVNYVISKDLWTGSEILALVQTILKTKNYQGKESTGDRLIDEDVLRQPLERRRKDQRGIVKEKKFLAHNPDRR